MATTSEDVTRSRGPLHGLKVLDLTSVFFGPYTTLLLGDMGAEVIKVEPPDGDILRTIGPSRNHGMSGPFLSVNRNKRSVVLDLRRDDGRAALLTLAKQADVFIHSMRPQAMSRLGLTYTDLAAANPRLVYCSATGFGRGGRYSGRPAYDDVIQGASGFASTQARLAGEPQYVASAIADKTAGIGAVAAVLAALYSRDRTGAGQEVEVPMFETMVSFLLLEHLYGKVFDPPLGEATYPRVTSSFRKPYATRDGHICVMVYNDKQWGRFFDAIERPELLDDPRFATVAQRTEHIDELYELLGEQLEARTTGEWMDCLQAAEIPAHPLMSVDDVLEDPHLQDVGFFNLIDHGTEGPIRSASFPFTFFGSPVAAETDAPILGADTVDVLRDAGIDEAEIAALLQSGVAVAGS